MPGARTINAADLVNDIRAGLSDTELIEKYRVSAKGLQNLFKQLLSARVMHAYEIYGREQTFDHTVRLEDLRRIPRHPIGFTFPVHDAQSPNNKGLVRDISAKGLKVEGLTVYGGEQRSLVIPPDDVYLKEPIEFLALCRWVVPEQKGLKRVCGLEIIEVSSGNYQRLVELTQSIPFVDEKVTPEHKAIYEEESTESLDLASIFTEDVSSSGSFRFPGIKQTWFGQLLQALPLASLVVDESLRVSFASKSFSELGIDWSALVGLNLTDLFVDEIFSREVENVAKRVYETRKKERIEGAIEFDVSKLWGRVHFRPLRLGQRRSLLLLIEDLTAERQLFTEKERHNVALVAEIEERKQAEQALRENEALLVDALEEKEVLLREIHHRVKNNLALISSMMSLQLLRLAKESTATRFVLTEVLNRIRSLALAHEMVYQSDNVAQLRIAGYVESLLDHLLGSLDTVGGGIRIHKTVEDAPASIDSAISLGFILTELVTNSLTHAFPDQETGEVSIYLGFAESGEVELIVEDTGVGLPEDVDLLNPRTLGLDIVDSFVNKLNGRIEVTRDQGTSIRIEFPTL